jgi:formylglycine-generating enzyme required for sulfatase activity
MTSITNKLVSAATKYFSSIFRTYPSAVFIIMYAFITIPASSQTKLKPGETIKDCPDCPEMVVIPAGSYMMGCSANDSGCYTEEKPSHLVAIQQFAAGKFDITRGQWAVFVAATNRTTTGGCAWSNLPADTSLKPWDLNPAASWKHLGFPQHDDHPAVCITWKDVQDYLTWISKKTGAHYRLLTEAEWEYAARAGTMTGFPWGSLATHEKANYGKDSCCGGAVSGRDRWMYTSPVGAFPPNAFGLYDMHGNVLQYVQDCFTLYDSQTPADGSAFKTDKIIKMTDDLSAFDGKSSCSFHATRGGDYGDPGTMVRSFARNWTPGGGGTLENYSSSGLGFRIARSL